MNMQTRNDQRIKQTKRSTIDNLSTLDLNGTEPRVAHSLPHTRPSSSGVELSKLVSRFGSVRSVYRLSTSNFHVHSNALNCWWTFTYPNGNANKTILNGPQRVRVKRGMSVNMWSHTAQINQFVTYLHLIIAEWLQPIITKFKAL